LHERRYSLPFYKCEQIMKKAYHEQKEPPEKISEGSLIFTLLRTTLAIGRD
jgi:hypothetical protein